MKHLVTSALSCSFLALAALHTSAQGQIVVWGNCSAGQCNLPALPPGLSWVEIGAGWQHCLARLSDGSVVAWGGNPDGQCDVPAVPPGVGCIEVAAGGNHNLARRSDGVVVAWGSSGWGECIVPALPPGSSYVELAAGGSYSLARRSDGSIVAWGRNTNGECDVPALPPGLVYVGMVAGKSHSLALRSDGSVVGWGNNVFGQCNVPALPSGLSYVEVAAGGGHSLARRSDGSVVAWGASYDGQCDVPALPSGLSYVEIDAGGSIWFLWGGWGASGASLARRSDGSVVGWGNNSNVPALPAGLSYVEVAANWETSMARTEPVCSTSVGYCTSGTTTSGCMPSIAGVGNASASFGNGFTISASNVEGQQNGLIFYGLSGQAANPWGTGTSFMCVKSPFERTTMQSTGGTPGQCDGVLSLDWNQYIAAHSSALGNPFAGGGTVWAQAWFRDPPSPKATNLSNGLHFTVCP